MVCRVAVLLKIATEAASMLHRAKPTKKEIFVLLSPRSFFRKASSAPSIKDEIDSWQV